MCGTILLNHYVQDSQLHIVSRIIQDIRIGKSTISNSHSKILKTKDLLQFNDSSVFVCRLPCCIVIDWKVKIAIALSYLGFLEHRKKIKNYDPRVVSIRYTVV